MLCTSNNLQLTHRHFAISNWLCTLNSFVGCHHITRGSELFAQTSTEFPFPKLVFSLYFPPPTKKISVIPSASCLLHWNSNPPRLNIQVSRRFSALWQLQLPVLSYIQACCFRASCTSSFTWHTHMKQRTYADETLHIRFVDNLGEQVMYRDNSVNIVGLIFEKVFLPFSFVTLIATHFPDTRPYSVYRTKQPLQKHISILERYKAFMCRAPAPKLG